MMTLSVVTPMRRVVGPISVMSVTVPGDKGEMTILPGHARLLGSLNIGVLVFEREDGRKEYAALSDGFVEVANDKVTVLAETLELAQEIDVDKVRLAQASAEEKLKAKEHFDEDMEEWQRRLQWATIRLQTAEFLLPPH